MTHFFLDADRDRLDISDESWGVEQTPGGHASRGLVDLGSLQLCFLDELVNGLLLALVDNRTHVHALVVVVQAGREKGDGGRSHV